jgi:hypothetical protein
MWSPYTHRSGRLLDRSKRLTRRTPTERSHDTFPHGSFGLLGEVFAAAIFAERNGIADTDQNIQWAGLEQFPGVTLHVHVAVPTDERAVGAAKGNAVEARIDD